MRIRLLFWVLAVFVGLPACGPQGPASMEFVEISPAQPRIGDVVTVTFRLIDARGEPLAGQEVAFKLQSASSNPGVTLSPSSTSSVRGTGLATVQLQANTRVNSVIVVATAGDKQVLSPPITFAGSVPNGTQFTFQCGPVSGDASGGRHAIGAYDSARNLIAGVKLECTAHVGDRNGDGVPNALVSFLTEAGTIGPTEISQTNVVGNATVLYKTSYPLPKDVDPDRWTWTPLSDATHTGEYVAPLWMEPFVWVSNPIQYPRPLPGSNPAEPSRTDPIRRQQDGSQVTNNPRDNLVALIAVTSGEEGFVDSNNNGVWDQGEEFEDLTEPFVDVNDNGTWDPDERFIDVNGNHQWDGKNGVWDANTLIWVQERILWTGVPHPVDALSPQPLLRPVDPPNIALTCPTGSATCNQAGPPVAVRAVLADPWYNTIAQNSEGDGCTIPETEGSPIKTTPQVVNQGFKYTYPAGDLIEFLIRDRRDPNARPDDQVPKRTPGISFTQPIQCTFTASAIGGHVIVLDIGTVTGTIE